MYVSWQREWGISQFCVQLLLEVVDELGHDSLNLLVVESLGLVLQDEVDGVALLAFRQVLAFVHVEEFDALEELLLCLACNLLNLLKLNALVDEQCEVAAYRWELADVVIEHLVLLDGAHHVVPVDVGEEHFLVDVHLLQKLVANGTHRP